MAGIWEKIKSVIFVEEDVDEEEEEEAVKPLIAPVKEAKPAVQTPAAKKPATKEPSKAITYKEPEIAVTHADWSVAEKPEVVTLGAKAPKPAKETVTERIQNKPAVAKPASKEPQINYQYSQVISPIYGMTSGAVKEKEPAVKPVSLAPAKPVEKSPLGTVLSPINGTIAEPKNEKLPSKVANLSIDDLINDDFLIDTDNEEVASPSVSPVRHHEDTENLSLFDEEEQ
ncbi:MAG: hypothetical protein IIY75_09015 [Erysipelotrichales bacterium]|nr:hypothetical protein [Erysipelotrichales bacterium]